MEEEEERKMRARGEEEEKKKGKKFVGAKVNERDNGIRQREEGIEIE
jgi:hypothetical protein